ncbi:membrane protein [Mycolicibacter heraklionensis]|uniref:Membrane protein n=1 Tax=Mycolicibacter heraklionensis TaxID=512402 RepID=A0A9X7WH91_9MYCO|nr:hypothetical protein [Mycolicibacter heraklionensis]KLO27487.1 membrane protein [Mycolicibacter heraklionensis]QZA08203.1 hypothetical protein K3U94_02335 [Mycolicibacter heraklionensis]
MNAVAGTVRKVAGAANRAVTMTTEAAGAIGGAAVNGVIGGVKGAAGGVQRGLRTGSHSTPAAALTLGALGVAGLVEWPVLVAVGGTALVLKQLTNRSDDSKAPAKAPAAPARPLKAAPPAKATKPVKSTNSSTSSRRSAQPKKTAARQSRSGASSTRTRTRH